MYFDISLLCFEWPKQVMHLNKWKMFCDEVYVGGSLNIIYPVFIYDHVFL